MSESEEKATVRERNERRASKRDTKYKQTERKVLAIT